MVVGASHLRHSVLARRPGQSSYSVVAQSSNIEEAEAIAQVWQATQGDVLSAKVVASDQTYRRYFQVIVRRDNHIHLEHAGQYADAMHARVRSARVKQSLDPGTLVQVIPETNSIEAKLVVYERLRTCRIAIDDFIDIQVVGAFGGICWQSNLPPGTTRSIYTIVLPTEHAWPGQTMIRCPPPSQLIITPWVTPAGEGCYLFRIAAQHLFAGWSWHNSVTNARLRAQEEYSVTAEHWKSIPLDSHDFSSRGPQAS